MAGDPPRRPSATPEGKNPEGQNPGDNAPDSEVPRRLGKEPMIPKDIADQGYTEGGDDEGYYEDDYYPTAVKIEVELLRQQLAEAHRANDELSRQLEESERNRPGKPKKKSTRRTQTAATEIEIVQTEAQARTCQAVETQI